jgi:pimeloyl-ACP methyl ester carboxylesterase
VHYRTLAVDGFTWNVVDDGAGPAVLLCHGFPGLAYSWRHQIEPLVASGFRVIAPDMPGYGGTDAPADIAEYTFTAVAGRLVALLDALDVDQAVLVGHDFGAPAAWTTALEHRDRVAGLMLLAMPYAPDRLPIRPSQVYSALAQKHFFHFEYFLQPGLAESELNAAPKDFLARLYHALSGDFRYLDIWQHPSHRGGRRLGYLDVLPQAPELPWSWLTTAELEVYETTYRSTGFTGGLNWYRAADLNWEQTADGRVLDVPACFLAGGNDPVITMAGRKAIHRMREAMPQLREVHIYDGAGHFIQMERADQVTAALIDFAKSIAVTGSRAVPPAPDRSVRDRRSPA